MQEQVIVTWLLRPAHREERTGWGPGPRVRPRLARWRAVDPAPLELGLSCGELLVVPAGRPDAASVVVTMDADDEGPYVDAAYVDALLAVGLRPLLLPSGQAGVAGVLDEVRGVVLTGGAFDIHPSLYGETPSGRLDRVDPGRTGTELTLCRAALAAGVPVLGVCGGMQAMAVAAGGRLIQDLPAEPTHEQPTDPAQAWHAVNLSGVLRTWWGDQVPANSTHHQAVAHAGDGFEVLGWSPDGVAEAMWHTTHPFALGVQWHPERLGDLRPYEALASAVATAVARAGRRP